MADLIKRDKKGKVIFSGPLAEPIIIPIFNALSPKNLAHYDPASGLSQIEAQRRDFLCKAWTQKMELLAQHFGYESAGKHGYGLAFQLALEFVPGFAISKDGRPRKGAPRRTDRDENDSDHALSEEVNRLRYKRDMTIASACAHLARTKGTWLGKNPKTLEARYHRLERTFVEIRRMLMRGPTPETTSLFRPFEPPTKQARAPSATVKPAKKKT